MLILTEILQLIAYQNNSVLLKTDKYKNQYSHHRFIKRDN